MDVAAVKCRKAELRANVQTVLDALDTTEIVRQSKSVFHQVVQHPRYQAAKSISLYLSTPRELQTIGILEHALSDGKKCYVPRYGSGKPDMEMVQIYSIMDYESLPANRWNIKQPLISEHRESVFDTGHLDLILVPGVAFSREGARLGHGKGYYDRFLKRCRSELSSVPFVLGLALSQQVLSEADIPLETSDQRLDLVLRDLET